jgi:hypothetical protein
MLSVKYERQNCENFGIDIPKNDSLSGNLVKNIKMEPATSFMSDFGSDVDAERDDKALSVLTGNAVVVF